MLSPNEALRVGKYVTMELPTLPPSPSFTERGVIVIDTASSPRLTAHTIGLFSEALIISIILFASVPTGVPLIVSTISPFCTPASAAGIPLTTSPISKWLGFSSGIPAISVCAAKRTNARRKFMSGPAKIDNAL
ncbi:hypothetical protein D3C73_1178730 [compost metagenome]